MGETLLLRQFSTWQWQRIFRILGQRVGTWLRLRGYMGASTCLTNSFVCIVIVVQRMAQGPSLSFSCDVVSQLPLLPCGRGNGPSEFWVFGTWLRLRGYVGASTGQTNVVGVVVQ